MNETWANTALKESRQRSSGDQRERERERAPVSIGFHLELGGRYSCKLWKQLATRPGNIRPANESNIAFDTLSSRVMIFGQGLVRPGRFAGRVRPDARRARTRGTTGVFVCTFEPVIVANTWPIWRILHRDKFLELIENPWIFFSKILQWKKLLKKMVKLLYSLLIYRRARIFFNPVPVQSFSIHKIISTRGKKKITREINKR